ncbi:MAG: hypothetical protein AB8G22_13870 [Saprospiraceae bacterium]
MPKPIQGLLIVLLVFVALPTYWEQYFNSLDRFAIGYINDVYKSPRKAKCSYVFTPDSIMFYKGYYRSFLNSSLMKEHKKIIVAYNPSDPDDSYPIFDILARDLSQVDSLNECCSPNNYLNPSD